MINADQMYRSDNDPEIQKDPEGVYFYGGPFSNFAPSPLVIDGKEYPTVEHYFQACKARDEADHEYVRTAPSAAAAKKRGRRIHLREEWGSLRFEVMLTGLRAKYIIPEYRKALLDTGERNIYEDSPYDFEWGFRNGGKNLLGKALMQVRTEIREKEEERDPDPYTGSFREAADNEGVRIATAPRGGSEE